MEDLSLERFMSLFRGNPRSYGQWNPRERNSDRASTTKRGEYDANLFKKHLHGHTGLGLVPILDDHTCFWGAIDIDNHGRTEDLDIATIEAAVIERGWPLVACRTKSGGVHLYLFGREPLRAVQVRGMLIRWMNDLVKAKVISKDDADCVFPKQVKLAWEDDGGRQVGNWINFPYFNAENTNRYAVENGEPLPFELFLSLAESKRVSSFDMDSMFGNEHSEAPPCIQAGMADKIDSGSRNEFAYNMTIYLKKRFPEDFRDRAYDLNNQVFKDPLPFIEIKKVVTSASRRDYRYKCSTEPCKSLCDRKLCLTKKYGITQDMADEMDAEFKLPNFTALIQYTTNPVRWDLTVEEVVLTLSTEELFDWRVLRHRIAERLLRIVPLVKNDKWHKILEALMVNCRKEVAPEDASADGIVKAQLVEFMRKIDLNSDGTDISKRKDLYRGIPVVQVTPEGKHVYFRGQDFTAWLKRQKCEELKGVNLWFSLKKVGVKHGRLRVEDKSPAVWYVAVDEEHKLKMDVPDFTPEL